MRPNDRYTYAEAGFNGFLSRSTKSNPRATSLRGGISSGTGRSVQFDRQHAGGVFMDKIRVGPRLVLDGVAARIIIMDEEGAEEQAWFGELRTDE